MRPRVICHMISSVDGRIQTRGWKLAPEARGEYERTAATFGAEAWMCGRVTMEAFAKGEPTPSAVAPEGENLHRDFVASGAKPNFAVAIDAAGKLRWGANEIDGDHVISVVTERAPASALASLRSCGVSYLVAGSAKIDFALALEKLGTRFGVKTVLLEGGGKINGSLLAAGLIDELSLLVAPAIDGTTGTPTLFDAPAGGAAAPLRLVALERRPGEVLWLRYRVDDPRR